MATDKCRHGSAFAGKCLECDLLWETMNLDQARERVRIHKANVEILEKLIAATKEKPNAVAS